MPQIDYYPRGYQEWLFAGLGLRPGNETTAEMLERLRHLNQHFVKNIPEQDWHYQDDFQSMVAYTLYYMTIQMPKLWFILDRISSNPSQPFSFECEDQIIDIGCGPGTSLWAGLFYLLSKQPDALKSIKSVIGIDQSATGLKIARQLALKLPDYFPELAHLEFKFIQRDWRTYSPASCDWLMVSNVIVEDTTNDMEWITKLCAKFLFIIEPGTCQVFHQILPLRNHLTDHNWNILFPCPSKNPCPMTANNWCHFNINRFSFSFIQRLSHLIGNPNHRHHFTGFAFTCQDIKPSENQWRVLSSLKRVKRSGIRHLCDGKNMREVVLNRKDKVNTNQHFINAKAGDALIIDPHLGKAHFLQTSRLTKDDVVTID